MKKITGLILSVLLLASFAGAQQAEVTIQLNEQFFDALLDAIFKNTNPPEFPLSEIQEKEKRRKGEEEKAAFSNVKFLNNEQRTMNNGQVCNETIKLQREMDGTKTAVRFRDGRIIAPIAFSGNYNPPFVGCVDFSGVAETIIELEFDAQKQMLFGRAKVLDVNLSGTGGLGGGLIAKMVQSSIDKKINPIQILEINKLSFVVPIQNAGSLKMNAIGIKHDIGNGVLNVRISYEFAKAE